MDYPEHEKLKAIHPQSQAIGEFFDWLQNEKAVVLGVWQVSSAGVDEIFPTYQPIQEMLEEFFDIDPKKLEAEKRQMLDEIRKERE